MKRALITILAIFYLGTSSGMTVHFHYCMGELVKWGVTQPVKSICDSCKAPKKNCEKSCCKDDSKQVKVDQSQKTAQNTYQFKQLTVLALNTPLWGIRSFAASPIQIGKASLSNAPPLQQDIPVFIRNCTYRI